MKPVVFLIMALPCFVGMFMADRDIHNRLLEGNRPKTWDIIIKYTCLLGIVCNLLSAHIYST